MLCEYSHLLIPLENAGPHLRRSLGTANLTQTDVKLKRSSENSCYTPRIMMLLRQIALWLCVLQGGTFGAPALAQLASGGFTGTINSPTADVLSPGVVSGTWNNSNPEKPRGSPAVGSFGSVNLGFGVLPGLELVGRLAFEGDLQCNMYSAVSAPCSGMRDLSASGKYQLPLRLGWDTRIAFGAVDVGGAATNFRSYYGVATSSFGSVDVTLGYGRGNHAYSSLDGLFGSTQVFLTEHWRALAEFDSHELRAGIRYARPLTEQLALEMGASRKLSNRTDQQSWQAGLGLTYSFDKHALNEGTRRPDVNPVVAAQGAIAQPTSLPLPAPVAPTAADLPVAEAAPTQADRAERMANRLQRAGFSSIWIGFDHARGWVIQAEPLAWRKNRLDALGVALALWQKQAQGDEQLHLVLSYLQDPVLTLRTSGACLAKFAEGGWWCDGQAALKLGNGEAVQTPALGWIVTPTVATQALRPQIELGPVLHQRVGTEVGLYDASVGLDLAWELALGRGVLWQGEVTVPLVNSTNFADGAVFGNERIQLRLESSMLSRQMELAPHLWAQASVGYVMHNDYGGQLDLAWLSPQGSLRLGALVGYYQGTDTSGLTFESIRHPLALASARWSVVDGRWFVEAQAGQFYNQDRGFRLASHHWYGDNRLTLHYRSTESGWQMPRTNFAGFEISMPIGNRAATLVGPVTVRGTDQWVYGVQSKVQGTDNAITNGYGVVPKIRHGLLNDTLDNDRAGMTDMMANLYRVRAMLREMADKP